MFYQLFTRPLQTSIIGLSLASSLLMGSAQAEFFGLANGRLADLDNAAPQRSVELGLVNGELGKADYDNKGVRFNYRLQSDLQLYADISQLSVGKTDETAMGVGAFYSLGKLFAFSKAVAVKGSIHQARLSKHTGSTLSSYCTGPTPVINPYDGTMTIDPGICGTTGTPGFSDLVSVRAMSLEVLLSSYPIQSIGFNGYAASWYANAGVHTFSGIDVDSEVGFGAGVVLPFSQGEVYAGLDIIDESQLAIGLRYHLK